MSDKDPEYEEGSESLSATGMFLRSIAPDPQQPAAKTDLTPPVTPTPSQKAEAGEFTRMFRPIVPAESAPAPPPSPPSTPILPPGASSGSEFTRAFIVPDKLREQPPPAQPAAPGVKGFSTPGVSDSASAEGSFTRIFRPGMQSAPPPQASNLILKEPESLPVPNLQSSPPQPEATFFSEVERTETSHQSSGVTELFRALSAADEKRPEERASRGEPKPVPIPYAEPTLLPRPEKSPDVLPSGGGVTALLSRLTQETPLIPPAQVPVQRVSIQPEIPAPVTPTDTRGEFTRLIQAVEIQAALNPANSPPAPPASPEASAPAPPAFTVPPTSIPLAHTSPKAPPLPPIAPQTPPKLTITPPAMPPPTKTKLQEMVPFLLVANAFLMLILILLVAFALHRK